MRLLLFLTVLLFGLQNKAQTFTQTSGPSGQGVCEAIYAYDDIVLTSINSKLFRSTDGGENFEQVIDPNFSTAALSPRCFAKVDDVIVMGALEGDRIFRSTDDGATWTGSNAGMPTISGFPAAVPTAATVMNDIIYMCGTNFIRSSSDLGLTWDTLSIDGLCYGINAVNGEVWAMPGGNLHRSTDDGETWQLMSTEGMFFGNQCENAARIGDDIFVTTNLSAGFGLYKSEDNGMTYNLSGNFNLGRDVHEILGVTYLSHLSGLSHTTDGGATWELLIPYSGGGYAGDFMWDGDNTIWCAGGNGLFKYNISEETYESIPFPVANVGQVSLSNGTLFGVTDGNLFSSSNEGMNWNDITALLSADEIMVSSVFADGTDVYVIANDFGVPSYYFSEDGGSSFVELSLPDGTGLVLDILSVNPVILATQNGLFISEDNGMNYAAVNMNDLNGSPVTGPFHFADVSQYGNSIFAAGDQGSAYSHDLGENWTFISGDDDMVLTGWPGRLIKLKSNPWPLYLIEESTDGGATWSEVSGMPFQYDGPLYIWMMDDKVYVQNSPTAFTDPGALYSMSESDEQWQLDTEYGAIPDQILSAQEDANGNILVGTLSTSTWYLSTSASSVSDLTRPDFALYPNPSSNSIWIEAEFGMDSYAIIDIQGRSIKSGVLRSQQKEIDIEELQEGLYQLVLMKEGARLSCKTFIKV